MRYTPPIPETFWISLASLTDSGCRLFLCLARGDYYTFDANGNITDTMHYSSGQVVKTYVNPEPRIAASYVLDDVSSVKASYVRNTQSLHLISIHRQFTD